MHSRWEEWQVVRWNRQGCVYSDVRNSWHQPSLPLLEKAVSWCLSYKRIIGSRYNSFSAHCYASLSDVELGLNNMDKAIEYMNQAVEISDSINGDRINQLKLTALYQKAAILLQQQSMENCKALCLQVIDDCKQVADLYGEKFQIFIIFCQW